MKTTIYKNYALVPLFVFFDKHAIIGRRFFGDYKKRMTINLTIFQHMKIIELLNVYISLDIFSVKFSFKC